MDEDSMSVGIPESISGRSTPISGPSTPVLGKRKQFSSVSTTASKSKSESVLEKALDALEKCQDDAQIFGDFIASSLRELPTVEKQQELKRALNRTLLDFQDAQARYQTSHIQNQYQASHIQTQYQASHGQTQYQASHIQTQQHESQFSWPASTVTTSSDSQPPLISNTNPNLNSSSLNISQFGEGEYLNL